MKKAHYDNVHLGMVWKHFHGRTDLPRGMQDYLAAPFQWVVRASVSCGEPSPIIAEKVNKEGDVVMRRNELARQAAAMKKNIGRFYAKTRLLAQLELLDK